MSIWQRAVLMPNVPEKHVEHGDTVLHRLLRVRHGEGTASRYIDLRNCNAELMKTQEAKTPVEYEQDGYWYYTCPTCGNHEELFREWNYCPFCGQAVKWD